MQECRALGCDNYTHNRGDFCISCLEAVADNLIPYIVPELEAQAASGPKSDSNKDVSSGGDNDYWVARIAHPKRLEPYDAECEDLIEYFQMSFAEGNAFKALWRMGMDRVAQGKPGDTPLRNAQKVAYYGARMEVMEERRA